MLIDILCFPVSRNVETAKWLPLYPAKWGKLWGLLGGKGDWPRIKLQPSQWGFSSLCQLDSWHRLEKPWVGLPSLEDRIWLRRPTVASPLFCLSPSRTAFTYLPSILPMSPNHQSLTFPPPAAKTYLVTQVSSQELLTIQVPQVCFMAHLLYLVMVLRSQGQHCDPQDWAFSSLPTFQACTEAGTYKA